MSSTAKSASPMQEPLPTFVNFATAGLGGVLGWILVHPFNTVAVRMNLASTSTGKPVSFLPYLAKTVRDNGVGSLYSGLSAGIVRQSFYATSRFGLYEVLRNKAAAYREVDIWTRMFVGMLSGGMAALVSCPAEVTLVRMSNDQTLPVDKRRNYAGVTDAFRRILREEGVRAFFSGSGPFVNRAMLVGAVQVGTYDQFRETFARWGATTTLANVFSASMASGFIYSVATMPFETAKNRMAFQRPDPITGIKPYRSTAQTLRDVVAREGLLRLWSGFAPYYIRCGGHTVAMFSAVEWLRGTYRSRQQLALAV